MTVATEKSRVVFRIRDWNNSYERHRSRELRFLEYVPFPNLMPDLSYVRLVGHTNGAAHFGIWAAIVFIASRCVIRGTLITDSGEPLEIADIAAVSRMPEALTIEAIPRFLQIGWLEQVPLPEIPKIEPKTNGHHPSPPVNGSDQSPTIVTPFSEWWSLWSEGTSQSSGHDAAEKEWNRSVLADHIPLAMACTKNFVNCDRTIRGIGIPNPQKFIRENSKEGWTARWPQARKSRGERIEENLERMHE